MSNRIEPQQSHMSLAEVADRRLGDRRSTAGERERSQRVVDIRIAELSAFTRHVLAMAESDKADLARDLHDELGSLLTAAKLDLGWLRTHRHDDSPEADARMTALAAALDAALDVEHRVVNRLHPALLDHCGLPAAIRAHFEETCRSAGLLCDVSVEDAVEPLPKPLAIALFRVCQESLTNIVRHAHASHVKLRLTCDRAGYHLVVTDDGVGISREATRQTDSHGLAGMRHRILSLNGRFTIGANHPRGTRIEVLVPHS